jgi:hypothetical protein
MQLAAAVGMLWLAVDRTHGQGEGPERLLGQLASVFHFLRDLDRRLAADGLGDLAPMRELPRRVSDVLAPLAPRVAGAQSTIADLVAALHAMEEALTALRHLKAELGLAP